MEITATRLVGAWQLRRWELTQPDGRRSEPFGRDARGLLLYSRDGWMSATIMAADRKPLSAATPRRAADAELAAAFSSYFSYCGQWRIARGEVQHDVKIALNPALVGSVLVRQARLTARTLTLTAQEEVPDGLRVHRLVWVRTTGVARRSARPARKPARKVGGGK